MDASAKRLRLLLNPAFLALVLNVTHANVFNTWLVLFIAWFDPSSKIKISKLI